MTTKILEKMKHGSWVTLAEIGEAHMPVELLRSGVEARPIRGGWKYRITPAGRTALEAQRITETPTPPVGPPPKKTRAKRAPKKEPAPRRILRDVEPSKLRDLVPGAPETPMPEDEPAPVSEVPVRLRAEPDEHGILVEKHGRTVTVSRVRPATKREARKLGRPEGIDLIDIYVLTFVDDMPPVVNSRRQFCTVLTPESG